MHKTQQKVTKDPKRQEVSRKGREKYMNKLKESILKNAKKVVKILATEAIMLPMSPLAPPPLPPLPPQDLVIPIYVGIVAAVAIGA